jgi:ubiquinone/menaquinone biosynthesis C-methylase UbiE
MFQYAKKSAEAAGLAADALDLRLGVAEEIPVESASFDTVICTLVSLVSHAECGTTLTP